MTGIVEFGLSDVAYAPFTIDPVTGLYTYEAPTRLPGAVSIALDPSGSEANFYADNGVYYASVANTGYTGTLVIAKATEHFRTTVLGEQLIAGGLLEASNARTRDVALMFKIQGDVAEDVIVYYDCTISRNANNANTTTDTVEVGTQEYTITVKPMKNASRSVKFTSGATTDEAVKTAFYTAIPTPEFLQTI